MIKNHISFAGTLALTFSMTAFAGDEPKAPQPFYDEPAYVQCVEQKLQEMHQKADEILARNPAEAETLIRDYGHQKKFPNEFIETQIANFRNMNTTEKHDETTLQLILASEPSPTFACQNDIFGISPKDAKPPLIMP